MEDGLASELTDCYNNQGSTIKKKDDTHRMAEANRALPITSGRRNYAKRQKTTN